MFEQISFLKLKVKTEREWGQAREKKKKKPIVFKKLHDIENWKLELKCCLTPKYSKIVNFI